MKLGEIAKRLGCELRRRRDGIEITGVAGIEEAEPGHLTFLTNRKYRPALETTRASAVLIARDAGALRIAALRSANPYLDFARAIEIFHAAPPIPPGIHPIGSCREIRENRRRRAHRPLLLRRRRCRDRPRTPSCIASFPSIAARASATISSRTRTPASAKTAASEIACCCRMAWWSAATASGSRAKSNGHWYKMRQAGITVVGDDVEIQAHSAIDRATIGETRIGRGTKIDNLVQVGHACTVGEDTLAVRPGGPGGNHARRQSLHFRRTGRRGRPSHHRRRRHAHGAKRSAHRRAGERRLLGIPGDG